MKINVKRCTWVLAIAAGIGLTGGAMQAVAAPFFQDQGPDYSKNKRYQQGSVKARVTMRISWTIARKDTSRKTKTSERTKPDTRRVRQLGNLRHGWLVPCRTFFPQSLIPNP